MEGRLEVQAGLNKVLGFFCLGWEGGLVLFFVVLAFFVCLFLLIFVLFKNMTGSYVSSCS